MTIDVYLAQPDKPPPGGKCAISEASGNCGWNQMKNLTRKVLLAALLSASPFTLAQTDPNADIYGRWKIKEMIGGGAASALSQRDVNKLIGKFVTINAERFSFNGRTCAHPTYQRRQEETVNFFDWAWRTDVSDIPFPNPVTVIETGCNTLFRFGKTI